MTYRGAVAIVRSLVEKRKQRAYFLPFDHSHVYLTSGEGYSVQELEAMIIILTTRTTRRQPIQMSFSFPAELAR